MSHDFRIGGILISTVVPALIAGLIVSVLLSLLLTRVGFYKLVWHRPLVDLAIFIMLFGLFMLFLPDHWAI